MPNIPYSNIPQEVFSTRKGQALEALALALIRCENEGINIQRVTKNSSIFQEWSSDGEIYDPSVCIVLPGTHWKGNSILLDSEHQNG